MRSLLLILAVLNMGFFSFWKKDKKPPSAVEMEIEIFDDSGFIGLVNNDLYNGFVMEDWKFEDLIIRFKDEGNKGNCCIWSTGVPNYMVLHVRQSPSDKKAFRESIAHIKVTNGCLWMANYEDLSMVAQYDTYSIPSEANIDLRIPLENGNYAVSIRQMFNPENYNWETLPHPCYELIFQKEDAFSPNNFLNVLWWDLDQTK